MEHLLLTDYQKIICRNPLFSGMTDGELKESVALMGGNIREYEKGELLHQPWSGFSGFGLVLSGVVQACCDDYDGNRMIMAEVLPGVTFGESLYFLQVTDSPVYIYASEDAAVLWLFLDHLYRGSTEPRVQEMEKRFTALIASRAIGMNNRIQVLSKITIRDKLLVYFSQMSESAGCTTFTVPLNREDMATYIGTNRTALSRELSKMKQEGIIEYRKNVFVLKNKSK